MLLRGNRHSLNAALQFEYIVRGVGSFRGWKFNLHSRAGGNFWCLWLRLVIESRAWFRARDVLDKPSEGTEANAFILWRLPQPHPYHRVWHSERMLSSAQMALSNFSQEIKRKHCDFSINIIKRCFIPLLWYKTTGPLAPATTISPRVTPPFVCQRNAGIYLFIYFRGLEEICWILTKDWNRTY